MPSFRMANRNLLTSENDIAEIHVLNHTVYVVLLFSNSVVLKKIRGSIKFLRLESTL